MRNEARLVLVTRVRTLFDLEELELLEDLEAVPALNEQDGIATLEDTALEIHLLVGIEVDANLAAFDEQRFLRQLHFAVHGIMDVRFDHVSRRVALIRQLLG